MSQMSPSRVAPHVEQGRCVFPFRPGAPDALEAPAGSPAGDRLVLSVADAAELLGVSEWLVLQQVRRGLLPHRRVGRRIVISRKRLLACMSTDDTGGDFGADCGSRTGAPGAGRR